MSRKCKRCGKCCLKVGRTFWKGGDFDDIEALNLRANDGDYEDNELPCEMFYLINGIGYCLIQHEYGYENKPRVCQEYPDGELCFNEAGAMTTKQIGSKPASFFERKTMSLEMKYFVLKPKAKSKDDVYARASQQAMLTYATIIQKETNDWEFAKALKAWAREEHVLQFTFEAGATAKDANVEV